MTFDIADSTSFVKIPYPDVLASRYASTPLVNLWGVPIKVILERKLWVAALKAQRDFGVAIPAEAIAAYERCLHSVNLESIRARELKTKQDVKARIEEFNALADYELIHEGFTSRDQTDNVEQLQIRNSLLHVRDRTVALLERLRTKAREFKLLDLCGRSHNVPGQTITLGEIAELIQSPDRGLSAAQVEKVCRRIGAILEKYPEAAQYTPEPIL